MTPGRVVATQHPSAASARGRQFAAIVVAVAVIAAGAAYVFHRGGGSSAADQRGLRPEVTAVFDVQPTITGIAAARGSVWASSESGGVTSGGTGLLWRIDPQGNQPGAPISIGSGAQAVAVAGGSVWTVSPEGTKRLDARTGRVLATLPNVRGSEVEAGGSSVWVGQTRIDAATNEIAATGAFDGFVTAIGPEGTWARSDAVERVDPKTGRILAILHRPGFTPNAIAVGGGSAWVAYASRTEWETTEIVRIDPATNRFAGKPIVLRGHVPSALAYAGGSLWLLAHNEEERGARLTQIDPEAGVAVGKPLRLTDGTPGLLAASDRTLWIAEDLDRGTVTRVDLR